jgi:hypothetical protein
MPRFLGSEVVSLELIQEVGFYKIKIIEERAKTWPLGQSLLVTWDFMPSQM